MSHWPMVDQYLMHAGLPEPTIPIPAERAWERQRLQDAAREGERQDQLDALERLIATRRSQHVKAPPTQPQATAPWGSAAARRQEIARFRQEIEERRQRGNGGPAPEST